MNRLQLPKCVVDFAFFGKLILSYGACMRYGLTIFISLLCTFIVAGVGQANAPAKPPSPLERSLMDSETRFIQSAKKGDRAFFQQTLTDDFSYVGIDGQLSSRQDRIDEFADTVQDLLAYNMKVVMASDDVAIVTYDAVVRVPPAQDQGPPPRYQHFSTLWVKQGEVWKMKFQQTTASHWGDW
jgi:hypothetical protein